MSGYDVMDSSLKNKEVERIRHIFAEYDTRNDPDKFRVEYPNGIVRKASVLIPLFFKDGQWRIVLTLRSKDLTHHAGYVAFPGGMSDDTDADEIHTALREAEEEIGLDPNDVEIIAVFSPGVVSPNSLVSPVLGVIPSNFIPKINEKEVSLVFDLPLERFLSKERLYVNNFTSAQGHLYHVYHFNDVIGELEIDTWGFTAAYCVKVAIGVFQSDQVFTFFKQLEVTKNNLFGMESLIIILRDMARLASKL